MTDYQILRLCLGIAESIVAYMVVRKNIGYCFGLGILMFFSAAYNIAPSYAEEPLWKHYIQTPCLLLFLGLTVAVTLDQFAFLRRRTFPRERGMLFSSACAIGCVPISAGWIWHPDNSYQALMLARQYILIGLAAGYASAWVWVTAAKPVSMEQPVRRQGGIWVAWLAVASLLASTTQGGLWWQVFRRDGGESAWRIGSEVLMGVQIGLCVLMAINLQMWRRHHDAVPVS